LLYTEHSLSDDDFDDFQAAPASAPALNQVFTSLPTQAVAPTPPIQPQIQSFVQPQQAPMQPNLGNVGILSPTSPRANSTFASPVNPNYGFSNVNTGSSILTPTSSQPRSNVTSPGLARSSPAASAKSSGGNFDDLWNMSLGSKPTATTTSGPAKSMKDLEKEKASAGIWGSSVQQQGKPPAMGMGLGSSSLGGFGSAAPPKSASGGVDDLLF
jgi:epsin